MAWIQAECADPTVGPQLGLKVPRGHVVCAHPAGVVREGFIWCAVPVVADESGVPDDSPEEPVEPERVKSHKKHKKGDD